MKPTTGQWLALCMVLTGQSLSGCYYAQAVRGHLGVMGKREPISEIVSREDTPDGLAARLRLVEAARQFSIDELGLPDNDSYRSYADLERDYVVWNVIAAPEFSLQPKTWCYPVVGCVSYRGYFDEAAARRKADDLIEDGYDVAFGGVAAYSTLGRFDDPVLNTMMHWEDAYLIAVMFHELAHQVVYVKDDSGFNESFATAVEEFGLERWLKARSESQALDDYRQRRDLERLTMLAIDRARSDLESIYASDASPQVMRDDKRQRLRALAEDIRALYAGAGRPPPAWLGPDLNNARLASLTLYHGRLPAFRRLLKSCNSDLACFYAEARRLAALDREARDERLDAL
jgi:predicted aminopeptidase